jgi:hypothetical protein
VVVVARELGGGGSGAGDAAAVGDFGLGLLFNGGVMRST